ncbi:hypothetical protein [Bufonid herpesvirus 1]|uniref:hypothetical protein n=1 Tax=Bufonid herpesvirus 1 TaxID=2282206 RepID=UPI000EB61986|nr:hypothetical protein [Bufonid herpesvirus 1]AXF48508.1 hypothetical protein [Bufonid herpesvirus 1]
MPQQTYYKENTVLSKCIERYLLKHKPVFQFTRYVSALRACVYIAINVLRNTLFCKGKAGSVTHYNFAIQCLFESILTKWFLSLYIIVGAVKGVFVNIFFPLYNLFFSE